MRRPTGCIIREVPASPAHLASRKGGGDLLVNLGSSALKLLMPRVPRVI